ncbi:MAG TPA: tyrosine-type recombinase/integrase [Fimbriimonadaceae bacterium]|nr:tyrosine-type recombinase/integrase [Fimbriimonadaceae bacterium]
MARTAKTAIRRLEEEPSIWLAKDGRYHWDVERRYDDGSQFRKGGACKELEAACQKRDAALAQFESGRPLVRYTVRTWAQHCLDVLWKDEQDNGKIKADTVIGHRQILANHILPMLGDLWLDAVGTEHARRLNQHLVELGRDADTRANIRNTGSKLYSTAMAQVPPTATHNPFKAITINRTKSRRDDQGNRLTHIRTLTVEEEEVLLSWAENHWAYGMVLAGLKMGLRKGELTAMTWDHIDWQREEYHVEEQIRRSRATGKLVIDDLKRTSSERRIPIHPKLLSFLKAEHERSDRHPVKVFANTNGNWISPEDSDEALLDLVMISGLTNQVDNRGVGLSDPTWHDLRHTFATRLATAKPAPAAPRTLMELLGHTNIETTFGYYVSSSFADKREAIALL